MTRLVFFYFSKVWKFLGHTLNSPSDTTLEHRHSCMKLETAFKVVNFIFRGQSSRHLQIRIQEITDWNFCKKKNNWKLSKFSFRWAPMPSKTTLLKCEHPCSPTWVCSPMFTQMLTQVSTHAKQLYWNHTSARVFSCKFSACFQNTFS